GECSAGIHDDLFCRVLLLKDNTEELALVSMDLVGLDFTLLKNLRQTIQKNTGLSFQSMMLHCTHTHNSPVTMHYLRQNQLSRDHIWEKELGEKISGAISMARNNLLPVKKIGVSKGKVQIGINRRLSTRGGIIMSPNPEGAVDPYVDVLKIVSEKETSTILFTHAAHPVSVHGASTLMTADYPGYAVRTIRRLLGKDVFPIFFQGCCGNINSESVAGGFKEADRLGTILGREVVNTVCQIEDYPSNFALESYNKEVDLPLKDPPSAEEAERILHDMEKGIGLPHRFTQFHRQEMLFWAKDLVKLARRGKRDYSLPTAIQIFTLGGKIAIIGLSHEVFVDYQLRIKKQSPFLRTFVFGYTNGVAGYIP
ncbi:hypothetical protein LCGC14_2993680, partial [marine sediment metagenome]